MDAQVQEIQAQLDQFMLNDKVDLLEFPTTLTSHDRFLVHELSEKMGLGHTSKGVGEERYIVVTKPTASTASNDQSSTLEHADKSDKKDTAIAARPKSSNKHSTAEANSKEDVKVNIINTGETASSVGKESTGESAKVLTESSNMNTPVSNGIDKVGDGKIRCKICGKDVIKANIDLHEIHCARKANQDRAQSAKGNETKKKASKSTKPRQFDKELAKKVEHIDGDDLDTLLDTVKKLDSVCCFKKCKTSVQTLCNVCSFCEGRYCMSHQMPEVHGCGDAARAHARARIGKDGVLYRGSGTPNKKPDDAKKAHLQRKLDSKLTDLASKRKSKPKK